MIGPLTAISRMETGAYGVEIGGAIYFAIFITIGAFIGINLLVVVVTTNLEQMMKAEQGQQHQIAFSEVSEIGRAEGGRGQCMSANLRVCVCVCVCVCAHTLEGLKKAKPEA